MRTFLITLGTIAGTGSVFTLGFLVGRVFERLDSLRQGLSASTYLSSIAGTKDEA